MKKHDLQHDFKFSKESTFTDEDVLAAKESLAVKKREEDKVLGKKLKKMIIDPATKAKLQDKMNINEINK